ncbi:hypothetical protein NQ314_005441, partial [Rhamnusium bicolor]
ALDNTSYKLLLKLNLDINKDSAMCNECLEKLLVPLHLISTCVYNVNSVVEAGDQWKCWFCTKFTERDGLIPLNESKENMFLLDILQEYFPELVNHVLRINFKDVCYDSL